MSKKYHVERREFLNKFSNLRAYVIAIVEDAREKHVCCKDPEEWHEISLRIADCSREIDLYFDLSTVEERENSLYKIRTLVEVMTEFKRAIEIEAEVINARESVPRLARVSAAVH
jgi:hypothetical protein